MKRILTRTTLLAGLLVGVAQLAQAGECSLAGVAGKYGYTSTGTIVNPAVGPFAAVGEVTFTRDGTFTGSQNTSIGGNLVAETITAVYSVNRDCTGVATAYVYHGSTLARTSTISLVWDNDQKEARAIFLTAGTAITIVARKMFNRERD
jgi:hypothetical protein